MMKRLALIFALAFAPRLASACTVCFGDPNSPTGQAMSMAILCLLCLMGLVFTGIGGFFFYLSRRAKLPMEHFHDLDLIDADDTGDTSTSHS